MHLTPGQERDRAAFESFVAAEIAAHADAWDRAESLPEGVVSALAARGYLGALVPESHGGGGMDAITFGLLNEALGHGCSSVRSVLTVHSMVVHAIARWGGDRQRAQWLPRLATGEVRAAFALTEPGAGSDAGSLATTARRDGGHYVLDGTKRWITYGQRAGVFLVFARAEGGISAFLVQRDSPGIAVVPMSGLLGTRASMLAELRLERCRVPASAQVGKAGFGLTAVATSALDIGRYSVAWGCAGIVRACVDVSLAYAAEREQFGRRLSEHQLIQALIADMVTNASAARLLCHHAGRLKDLGDPQTVSATWAAKYFASRAASRAAADAVQIHGANGCGDGYPVQRLFRDAKVMEIIEGSTQIQQTMIARLAQQGCVT